MRSQQWLQSLNPVTPHVRFHPFFEINVALFQLYPQRWSFLLNLLSWIPSIRNSYLIVETKIEPLLSVGAGK
ncbi:hypothetical protein [Scytonema hofmannii]|uniref:hypothetical protein n=1 Tax=Scytonema hofmannii TaxID=34078 RepID=UPI00034C524A|nr:hypothetical protein [Scytonema hofmannii]